jgi:ribosomal protein L7/L12
LVDFRKNILANPIQPYSLTSFPMTNPFPTSDVDEIQRRVLAGDKIGAIKLYRERTGVGLAEAKSAIEQLQTQLRGLTAAELTWPPKALERRPIQTAAIAETLFRGEKIAAIKLYREQTQAGLAEAKRAVEEIEKNLRASAPGLFAKPAFSRMRYLVALMWLGWLIIALAILTSRHGH